MDEFERWRATEMKKKTGRNSPAKSTINKHNIVLRAVFDFAVSQKMCKVTDVPKLTIKKKGRKSERRGAFSQEEYNQLLPFMKQWAKDARTYISKYKRTIMMIYVQFLFASGARPGNESLLIEWKDFEPVNEKGKIKCYRIHMRHGKKGKGRDRPNEVVQSHRSILISKELYEWVKTIRWHYPHIVLENGELQTTFPNDLDYVFCMPDGSPIVGLSEMFKKCLVEAGLYYAADGRKRTLYSCRHSYATWKLATSDVTYEMLRHHMGTSVTVLQDHYDQSDSEKYAEVLIY